MKNIIEFIKKNSKFIILGHLSPDADAIGSQKALGLFLKRIGKQVILVSPGPFTKPEISLFERDFQQSLEPKDIKDAVVIVCDCSTLDRIKPFEFLAELPLAVIDHHSSGEPFGLVRYIDVDSPSTTLLIQKLIEEYGETPTKEEAYLLFLGVATDTNFFKFLDIKNFDAFYKVGDLVKNGANPKEIAVDLNSGKKLANIKLMNRVLSRVESFYNNQLLISYETKEDRLELNATDREAGTLYSILQSVDNNEIVIILREDKDQTVVGLRSLKKIDVGSLAQNFGGGGHVRAAGFSSTIPLEALKIQLVELVKGYL